MGQEHRPRVVVVVPNRITGDSRVIKTALTAARAGWDVVLLGQGRRRRQQSWLGPVQVVRVPIRRPNHDAYEASLRTVTGRRPSGYAGPAAAGAAGLRLGRYVERRRTQAGRGWRRPLVEAELLARRVVHRVRRWGSGTDTVRTPDTPVDEVQWRRDWPILVDWSLTFGPVLEELAPDLIHSNDAIMVGVVAEAVARMRAAGSKVAWIHDAHEHTSAVDWGDPLRSAAFRQYEAEYIGQADAVVTVSPEIAQAIEDEYDLGTRPAVVRNAPVRHVGDTGAPAVREVAGVPEAAPLVVYSGHIEPRRGLVTAVDALPRLDDVHLVLVTDADPAAGVLGELLARARELSVADRVRLAPYVPPHQVPAYLASADLGIFPGLRYANQENSLPTKLPEYLHAGLPLIVSDLRTMSGFVREHAVGEVFRAGDAADLAAAVRRALAGLETMRDNITDELLDDLSWERQAQTLLGVYSSVTGLHPTPPPTPVGWNTLETTEQPADQPV